MVPAFESGDEVRAYLNGDLITCLICGRSFRSIGGRHLGVHGVLPMEYRARFNLPAGVGLASKASREASAAGQRARADREALLERLAAGRCAPRQTARRCKPSWAKEESSQRARARRGIELVPSATWSEFLLRMACGRTVSSVALDDDMPNIKTVAYHAAQHPEFDAEVRLILTGLPFSVQAAARGRFSLRRSEAFAREVQRLFVGGLTDEQIAATLGTGARAVRAVTVNLRAAAGYRGCGRPLLEAEVRQESAIQEGRPT